MSTINEIGTADTLTEQHELSPITAFNRGGPRLPLLFFQTFPGELRTYQALAEHLGPDYPLYTIAPPQGQSAEDFPNTLVEWAQWASRQTTGLAGEFIMGGNSFGGLLALQTSLELTTTDLKPIEIVLLDTMRPNRIKFQPRSQIHRAVHHLSLFLDLAPAERGQRLTDLWRARRAQDAKTRRRGKLANADKGDFLSTSLAHLPLLKQAIWKSHVAYEPRTCDLPVTVFWTEQTRRRYDDALLGWGPWLRGRVHAESLTGTHHTFMDPHNIGHLAANIRALERRVSGTRCEAAST